MAAGGFHSFVFKKDVEAIRRYSSDAATRLEAIYQTHGARAGYCAANAIKRVMESVNSTGGAANSNWQAELRECPQAIVDARRAVESFAHDYGALDARSFRD
jgi:hypothetical protein